MADNRYLLVCDWGTSNFRLGLYDLQDQVVLLELRSAQGVAVIYEQYLAEQASTAKSRDQYFRAYLAEQIAILSAKTSVNLANTVITISGMASSSIGMALLPYAALPFPLDGTQMISRQFAATDQFPHRIILLSGVQSDNDVMRGEETQLIGIAGLLAETGNPLNTAVAIFPGTHSKHIYTTGHHVTDIKTFMTGELYQLMAQYSILKDSIEIQDQQAPSAEQSNAFSAGVQAATSSSLLHALFTVRTNQLFSRYNKSANAFYLSGLLIGTELQQLQSQPSTPVFLCSGNRLFTFYQTAIQILGLTARTTFISQEATEQAAIAGQKIIYEQYLKKFPGHE